MIHVIMYFVDMTTVSIFILIIFIDKVPIENVVLRESLLMRLLAAYTVSPVQRQLRFGIFRGRGFRLM